MRKEFYAILCAVLLTAPARAADDPLKLASDDYSKGDFVGAYNVLRPAFDGPLANSYDAAFIVGASACHLSNPQARNWGYKVLRKTKLAYGARLDDDGRTALDDRIADCRRQIELSAFSITPWLHGSGVTGNGSIPPGAAGVGGAGEVHRSLLADPGRAAPAAGNKGH